MAMNGNSPSMNGSEQTLQDTFDALKLQGNDPFADMNIAVDGADTLVHEYWKKRLTRDDNASEPSSLPLQGSFYRAEVIENTLTEAQDTPSKAVVEAPVPDVYAAPDSQDENLIWRHLHSIMKRWWLIILAAFIGSGLGYAYITFAPGVFQASTTFVVESSGQSAVDTDRLMQQFAAIIAQPDFVDTAANALNMPASHIRDRVSIEANPDDRLITLSARSHNPQLTETMAKTVAETYRQAVRQSPKLAQFELQTRTVASMPQWPISPNPILVFLLTTLLGILIMGGALYIISTKYGPMNNISDVTLTLGLPTLTTIPEGTSSTSLLFDEDPNSPVRRAFHVLRTRLQPVRRNAQPKTIVITAPSDMERQRNIVLNLGVALAEAGYRTLMIDANVAQPQLHRVFSIPPEPGLGSLLKEAQGIHWRDAEPVLTNLYLLTGGAPKPGSHSVFDAESTEMLFNQFDDRVDIILVNAPSVLTSPDTLLLATKADRTILALSAQATPRAMAIEAADVLGDGGAASMSVVLTDIPTITSRRNLTLEPALPQ